MNAHQHPQSMQTPKQPTPLHGVLAAGVLGAVFAFTAWLSPWCMMVLHIVIDRGTTLAPTSPLLVGLGSVLAMAALAMLGGVLRVVQVRRPLHTLVLGGVVASAGMVAYAVLHAFTGGSGMPGELWPVIVIGFGAFAGSARLL